SAEGKPFSPQVLPRCVIGSVSNVELLWPKVSRISFEGHDLAPPEKRREFPSRLPRRPNSSAAKGYGRGGGCRAVQKRLQQFIGSKKEARRGNETGLQGNLIRTQQSRLDRPRFLADEEVADDRCDLGAATLERKMTGIEQTDFGVRVVAFKGLRT